MTVAEHRQALGFTPVTPPPQVAVLREEVRAFLAERLPPGSYRPGLGMHGGFDRGFSRALGQRGWLGMTWPREYGGHERTQLERYVVVEELLRAGAPVMAHWIADRQIGPSILHHGPEPLRRRFLPAIARGECAFSLGMSEPAAGSDLASVRTRAQRVDGGWSLTGTKVWTGGAHVNDFVVVLCRTAEATADRHEGLSQLVVDLHAPGVSVEPIPNLDGGHRFNRVIFDGVFVGDDMVLGAIGRGWEQVTAELAFERAGPERFLSVIGLITGLADTAGSEAREDLGDLVARLAVLRELSMSVAEAIDRGATPAVQAALVKHQGTEFEQDTVDIARRRADVEPDPTAEGPAGELARAVAFAPGFTIQGGTNEVLRTVVARALREERSGPVTATGTTGPPWEMSHPLPRDLRRDSWDPVLDTVRADAVNGVSSPLADAAVGAALAGIAGLDVAPRTVAADGRVTLRRDGTVWLVDAELDRVPWGRDAEHVLVVAGGRVLRLPAAAATRRPGTNLGGEPRDALTFADHPLEHSEVSGRTVLPDAPVTLLGALARTTAIAGALQTVCSLVTGHARAREQFGRPLDRFQAVQAHLVTVASETASAGMAAELGRRGLDDGSDGGLRYTVAVAKVRAAAAATAATRAAHQVLGAVGTTELHELGHHTRRLWSWRDEHGSQVGWQRQLGHLVTAAGGAGLWDLVTGGGR